MRTEDLIGRLAMDLRPVRPLSPPWWRIAGWLAFAAAVIAGMVAWWGLRPDIGDRMRDAPAVLSWVASIATGVLAAVAAVLLALPDRSPRWALLPLPAAAVWVGMLGLGCLTDALASGPAALLPGLSWRCTGFILGLGLPLAGSLVWLLRHAAGIRPVAVAAMGGLAGAALSAAGLWLFHEHDAAAEALVWHAGLTFAVAALGAALGRRWRDRAARRFIAA